MVPREILVGICKAWKKLVFSGPRPVFCAGMVTAQGASAPARAGARFLFWSSFSRMSHKSLLVNTKPTFWTIWGRILQEKNFFWYTLAQSYLRLRRISILFACFVVHLLSLIMKINLKIFSLIIKINFKIYLKLCTVIQWLNLDYPWRLNCNKDTWCPLNKYQ